MTTYPPRRGTDPQSLRHWAVACVASARVLRAEGHPGQAADLEHAATRAAPPPPHHHDPGSAHLGDVSNPDRDDDEGASGASAVEDPVGEGPSWWR